MDLSPRDFNPHFHHVDTKRRLECGDSSSLLLAATRRGESTADESAVEKAGASSRTPKLVILPRAIVDAGARNRLGI